MSHPDLEDLEDFLDRVAAAPEDEDEDVSAAEAAWAAWAACIMPCLPTLPHRLLYFWALLGSAAAATLPLPLLEPFLDKLGLLLTTA